MCTRYTNIYTSMKLSYADHCNCARFKIHAASSTCFHHDPLTPTEDSCRRIMRYSAKYVLSHSTYITIKISQ